MSYHRPSDLDTALALAADGAAQIVAGGTDYYPSKGVGPGASAYLDITQIAAVSGIRADGAGFWIGAATTWSAIIAADLPPAFDGLKAAAREVGSVQIQNAGTVAGNLCNGSPAADGVPPLLTLEAQVELMSAAQGKRVLPLEEFITGVRQTALGPGEIVSAIVIPPLPSGARAAFEKLGSRRYLVISIAMSAVLLVLDEDGRIAEARVAVGACSPVARRLSALEAALIGQRPAAVQIDPALLGELTPIDDMRASATYRLDAVAVQIASVLRLAGSS